jgi:hypothetical protein
MQVIGANKEIQVFKILVSRLFFGPFLTCDIILQSTPEGGNLARDPPRICTKQNNMKSTT